MWLCSVRETSFHDVPKQQYWQISWSKSVYSISSEVTISCCKFYFEINNFVFFRIMDGEILESSNYSASLLGGLRSLRLDDQLCDLTLVADNLEVKVHRAVVAASSDYFRALLTTDMKEKGQETIALKGVPGKGLKSVVNFIYTGKLHCCLDNISEVLVAATHLQQSEAIQLCNGYLAGLTNSRNCVDMYNLSETFGLSTVQQRALALIFNNFEEISNGQEFFKFHQKFLGKVLCSDKLRVASELKLYELILKWINYNLEERKRFIGDLMQHVRFPLIPAVDLVTYVMEEPLMRNDPVCLELIMESNKYHMLPERQAITQTNRTQIRTDRHSIVMLDLDGEGPKVLEVETKNWGSLGFTNIDTFHAQVCVLDNYMYICGGIDLYNSANPVSAKSYRYDPRFDSWCDITPMQEPRHHFVLVGDNKSLYAIGGYCNGAYRNVVEQYMVAEDQWVYRSPIGANLSAAAAAYYKGRIYLSGGQNEQGITKSETEIFTTFGRTINIHP